MTLLFALTVWVTLSAGLYLALSRDLLRCVFGLAMLGGGANLLLLASGRLLSPQPAVVAAGEQALAAASNPLPQALVLTAIVIGFGLLCFSLVLLLRLIPAAGTDDVQALRQAEPPSPDPVKPALPQPGCEPPWPPELPR